jgi:hypothetical protein
MPKIRKINVSQMDGNSSNENNPNEIRPLGEAGFYVNNDNGQLELLIFNGLKTHLKSKILGPGVFYGANSDSGDGEGLDTIKLIPDVETYRGNGGFGNDQYLVVDPTAPNHIHLRAGGDIDNSSADLYLGGEKTNIIVSDGGSTVSITTTQAGDPETTNNWFFNNLGEIGLPNNSTIDSSDGNVEIRTGNNFNVESANVVNITTNTQGSAKEWQFNESGNLILPLNGNIQFGQEVLRLVSPPEHSYGAAGDTLGDFSFDSGHFYYCIENFGGIQYTVLHAIAEGSADGVNNGYLVSSSYQLPQVGWKVYYDNQETTINQVNSEGIPGFYVIFTDTPLEIPAQTTFAWGSVPEENIWKRVSWSDDTW